MSEGKDVEMEVTEEKPETTSTDQTVTSAPKEDKDLLTVEGSTCIYLKTTTCVQWVWFKQTTPRNRIHYH